jgi:RimJ/RimL family protein N-acetyltransferase
MVPLQTDPLILRRFRESDLVEYAEMCADPMGMPYIGMGKTLSCAEAWLEGISELLRFQELSGWFAIFVEKPLLIWSKCKAKS